MKTLKINLVAVLAVMISVGMMSFQLATNTTAGWYALGAPTSGGTPIQEHLPSGPADDCIVEFDNDLCAVEWTGTGNPPQFLEQISGSPQTAGRTP